MLVHVFILNFWIDFGEVKKSEYNCNESHTKFELAILLCRLSWRMARMVQGRGVHSVLVGKPEGKRPLGRPRRRWEDNIKMDLQEVGGGGEDWMELAQDRDR